MKSLVDKFDRLFIDEGSRGSELAERMLSRFPSGKVEWVRSRPYADVKGELSAAEFDRSKRNIYLTRHSGRFFKRCPGAKPGLLCCNYFVLNWGQQCDMNCSYCYLQSYINNPAMTLYTNLEDAFAELRELHASLADQKIRVGTGETVDSLSLDPLTGFAARLIALFREFPNWRLEFKTKSAFVEQFLDEKHSGNVIVSWSLNPQAVIESEEHGTAPLTARLKAAELCAQKGFPIAFHLDPMIWHPEWEKNYDTLVDEICARFSPDQVPYLSVGALRFQPEQRHLMRERFGLSSWVTRAEMHPSADGKLRYPAQLRKAMFERMEKRFADRDPRWRIFLCMETPESWTSGSPFKSEPLHDLFDPKVARAVRAHQGATDAGTA